jgi:hypothetical protein
MAHTIPDFLAATQKGKHRWKTVGWLLLFLTACDRPGTPPGPSEPPRPRTMAAGQSAQVQNAVFNYAKPNKNGAPALPHQIDGRKCCKLQV